MHRIISQQSLGGVFPLSTREDHEDACIAQRFEIWVRERMYLKTITEVTGSLDDH